MDEKDLDDIKPVYTNERMKYDRFFVELEPLKNFYTAEEYHQDYLDKHPNGYCHITAFEMEEVKKLNHIPCHITVVLPSEKELTLEVPKNTTISELIQEVNTEHHIYAALINHKTCFTLVNVYMTRMLYSYKIYVHRMEILVINLH